ncbi:MAG: methyltransferase domain-containing protein [Methanobacteriaceae archaeon]|nr:methyltransferase domain-containing protein [Methanobacteriaceae archaeon]
MAEKMVSNDCEVVGIEIDEKTAQKAKTHCQKVFVGNVESIELSSVYENYFDYIIFADVLEHLIQPLEVLFKFMKYLKADGRVVVSLPNISNWRIRFNVLMGNFEYNDQGLLGWGHIRFFNVKSAKKLISEANMEIVSFDVTVGDLNNFAKVFYKIGKIWSNLLAFQFLIITKKKDLVI